MNSKYSEAANFLESFIDYEKIRPAAYSENEYDVSGFRKLVKAIGNPQKKYKTIHLAGTKGKGSTSAFIEAALRRLGKKTGLYTSPHIYDYTERIKTNGKNIPPDIFADYVLEIGKLNETLRAEGGHFFRTVFEILTASGFKYFADQKVDTAVIETGLGGRLDCTNVIIPELSIITSMGYDHVNILGDTIEKITLEKAGIIKENIPVLIAKQSEEFAGAVRDVIKSAAAEKSAAVFYAEEIMPIIRIDKSGSAQKVFFKQNFHDCKESEFFVSINVAGKHQAHNLQTALAAVCILPEYSDMKIDFTRIKNTALNIDMPGRFEAVGESPLFIIDGAHCPLSVEALCKTFKESFPEKSPLFLLGVLSDKNAEQMLQKIHEYYSENAGIIIFPPPSKRASDVNTVKMLAEKYFKVRGVFSSIEEALENANCICTKTENSAAIVFGSLYNIAPAKEKLAAINEKSAMKFHL